MLSAVEGLSMVGGDGCLRWCPADSRDAQARGGGSSRWSGVAIAGSALPLDLEELRPAGERPEVVPELDGGLAARHVVDDGAEDRRRALEDDSWHAEALLFVELLKTGQDVLVRPRIGDRALPQVGRQLHLRDDLVDDGGVGQVALIGVTGIRQAEVEALERLVAVVELGERQRPQRRAAARLAGGVLQVLPRAVDLLQAEDVPIDVERALVSDLTDPMRSPARPRSPRIGKELDTDRLGH